MFCLQKQFQRVLDKEEGLELEEIDESVTTPTATSIVR